MLFRPMGKNIFAHIQQEGVRFQVVFNRDLTKVVGYTPREELSSQKFLEKKLDLGDFIGVKGHLFRTHKGELSLLALEVTLLCKTLLPLPDKHSGLTDKETRFRKRWLDLIMRPEVLNSFKARSLLIKEIRSYFHQHQFIEVETPILQNLYGGAQAKPFITELLALHQPMYLRIALEIALKKLIVGGIERCFEISKVFRNEGIDRTHNPEFTMLEAYAAYWDYEKMMVFVENLVESLCYKLHGKTTLTLAHATGEVEVEFKAPWKRISMKEAIKLYGKIDVDTLSLDNLRTLAKENGCEKTENAPKGLLISFLFETLAEPHLLQPHHVIDHPIETTPLCKLHRDPKLREEGFVERFESFVLGKELCNSYTELNDPELQRALLVEQAELKNKGEEEASPLDEEFIEAICQGMPPTGGIGIGIDRLCMLLLGQESIREVLFFPLMRAEEK